MDLHLAEGGRELATRHALAAYEGHRAQDRLMVSVSRYVRGEGALARAELAPVRARNLLRGPRPQNRRMLALYFALLLLTRLPRIAPVAAGFSRRWHAPRRHPATTASSRGESG